MAKVSPSSPAQGPGSGPGFVAPAPGSEAAASPGAAAASEQSAGRESSPDRQPRPGFTAGPDSGPALSVAAIRASVLTPGSIWSRLEVTEQTGSTNADLLAAARAGVAAGAVLVAERQTSGRGRQGRSWISRPGAALTFSVLLRPGSVPPSARGWLPLLTGVALARALQSAAGVDVALKWPNDVLAGGAKLAGILAEQADDAIVVGIGLNVGGLPADLTAGPGALAATSLALCGAAVTDRAVLLAGVLGELERWYRRWVAAGGDPVGSGLRAEYLRWCATVGADLRVQLPGGSELAGVATGIDAVGRLLVTSSGGDVAVSAGDVVHVR